MIVLGLLAGLAILVVGAELLVRSASALALVARVSPLVIGLTIVAFGTSTPELVVSLRASLSGQPDVAVGNVVGSNIFNVLFILGVSALIIPMRVSARLIQVEVPMMIGLSVLVLLLALDRSVGRVDGVLLATGLLIYTVWAIRVSRRESASVVQEFAGELPPRPSPGPRSIVLNVVLVVLGLLLLVFGARLFTNSAIEVARYFGLSELLIGLTVVAAGTSLPEVAASVMAAIRGERDIAVGNVVGSNIFNILGVLGLSGAVAADGLAVSEAALRFDVPVMIVVAFACLPIFFTGHQIDRWEGGLLVGYCFVYLGYLYASATSPEIAGSLNVLVLVFLAPLTLLTLAVGVARSLRARRSAGDP